MARLSSVVTSARSLCPCLKLTHYPRALAGESARCGQPDWSPSSASALSNIAGGDPANALAAGVEDRAGREIRQVDAESGEEGRERRRVSAARAVLRLDRDAGSVRAYGAEKTLGAALREPAGRLAHEAEVRAVRAADEIRAGTHRSRDPGAAR